jgi:hypothetical protein
MSIDDHDARRAVADAGQIFEREWLAGGEWLRVVGE